MSYEGPLMQMKRVGTSEYDDFPLRWIVETSYKTTPNQRLDTSDSKRAIPGVLHRTVLSHTPSKVEFNLCRMTNADIAEFNTFMRNHYTVPLKREFIMRLYNVEEDAYTEGTYYMPDPQYTIRQVDPEKHIIKYEETRIAFIQN